MKHDYLIFAVMLAATAMLSSCNGYNKQAHDRLTRAEALMETHPDSAMLTLDSIPSTKGLSHANEALYALLKTQAMNKIGTPPESDSLIVKAVEYYSRRNDIRRRILSYFYQSRALRNDSDEKLSLNILLKAEEYAEQCDDKGLVGLVYFDLGRCYQMQHLGKDAIKYYEKALTCFKRAGKQENEMSTLNHIGWSYMILTDFGKAESLFRQELEIAEKSGDSVFIYEASHSLASAYYRLNRYNLAKCYTYKSINCNKNSKPMTNQYLLLGNMYGQQGKLDSVRVFYGMALEGLEQVKDTGKIAGTYYYLYQIEKANINSEKALEALEKYIHFAEAVQDQKLRNSIEKIKLQYDHEKLLTEKQRLTIRNRNLWLAVSVMLLIVVSIVAVHGIVVSRKNKRIMESERKEKEAVEKQKEEEGKTQHMKIEKQQLEIKVNELEMRKKQARNQLLSKLNMIQKMNAIGQLWSDDRKDNRRFAQAAKNFFDEFIFTQESWHEIFEIANQVITDDFYKKLKHPDLDLSDDDIRLCSMIVIGMKTSEIAQILNILPNSVSKKRNRLRKKIRENSDDTLKNLLKSWS